VTRLVHRAATLAGGVAAPLPGVRLRDRAQSLVSGHRAALAQLGDPVAQTELAEDVVGVLAEGG
jgi:hypothetical protein